MAATHDPVTIPRFNSVTSRQALYMRIKGQTALIPDLKPIFAGWQGIQPHQISPWLVPLRLKVANKLKSFSFGEKKMKRLEASDFALFTALWWPGADFPQIEILAYLVIWLFTWDDEIDEPTGFCANDFAAAQLYRAQTLEFVAVCLKLSTTDSTKICPQNQIIASFDVIGEALCASYTVDQRKRVYREIDRFMTASENEQKARLEDKIPTLAEYWSFRLGTSAVYIGSAAGEFSIGSCLPPKIMETASMQAIWNETNVIISITNDLLSLKKEMKLGCIDSIVPLVFATSDDVEAAVKHAVAELQASRNRFDEAEKALLKVCAIDNKFVQETVRFVRAQQTNCIGNLIWSLETYRYGMSESMNKDGSQSVVL